jgi:predicted dehydrogenase
MESAGHSVLVVGSGSIGRRHLRNLRALGFQRLAACDLDRARLDPVVAELGIQPFTGFEAALDAARPDLVFVCTPPVSHVSLALRAVRSGAHVFVEKPLSNTLDGVDDLIAEAEAGGRTVQVGYNMRYHPGLGILRQMLADRVIGRVLWVQAEVGQYLPDWRPWQDYRRSYTASREMGGGAILDASHELDYTMWLFGKPVEVACMAGRVSGLEMNVEDCATLLLRFSDGMQAGVHMDLIQRRYSRTCKLVGELGTLVLDDAQDLIREFTVAAGEWRSIPYLHDANQTYVAELEHFLAASTQKNVTPIATLAEARSTLQVALAAHEASNDRKWVSLA